MNIQQRKTRAQAIVRQAKEEGTPHSYWGDKARISSSQMSQFMGVGHLSPKLLTRLEEALIADGLMKQSEELALEPLNEDNPEPTDEALGAIAATLSEVERHLRDQVIPPNVRAVYAHSKLVRTLESLEPFAR